MTLTEQRARTRAKEAGFRIVKIPEKSRDYSRGYLYRIDHHYVKSLDELNKVITAKIREKKKVEMMRKLNGHRPKYGYKTIPRERV